MLGLGSACLVSLAVAAAFAAPAFTTACTTHQCDSDFVNIDQATDASVGELEMLDDAGLALWESSPVDGTWIDYPGQRTYFFSLPPFFTPLQPPVALVSTNPAPNEPGDGGGNYTLAAGQLAVFGPFVNGGFLVSNQSCAEYYLYISVLGTYAPPAPAPPPPDDAGAGD